MRPQEAGSSPTFVHFENRRPAIAIRNVSAEECRPGVLDFVGGRRTDFATEIRKPVIAIIEYRKLELAGVLCIDEMSKMLSKEPICRRP